MGLVFAFDNVVSLERNGEARPAAPAVELLQRSKQRLARNNVDIDSGVLLVPELVVERGSVALSWVTAYWREFSLARAASSFWYSSVTSLLPFRPFRCPGFAVPDGGRALRDATAPRVHRSHGHPEMMTSRLGETKRAATESELSAPISLGGFLIAPRQDPSRTREGGSSERWRTEPRARWGECPSGRSAAQPRASAPATRQSATQVAGSGQRRPEPRNRAE